MQLNFFAYSVSHCLLDIGTTACIYFCPLTNLRFVKDEAFIKRLETVVINSAYLLLVNSSKFKEFLDVESFF